jgi:hypothetical protein
MRIAAFADAQNVRREPIGPVFFTVEHRFVEAGRNDVRVTPSNRCAVVYDHKTSSGSERHKT